MNFAFSEEQELLRSQVRKFLDEQCPLPEVRRCIASAEGYSRPQWKQLAEMGWLGLAIPEAHGGAGLGWVDVVVLLEETGRSLYPGPLLSHLLCADAIAAAGDADASARWLPRLAEGSVVGGVALAEAGGDVSPEAIVTTGRIEGDAVILDGEKRHVADAAACDLFAVSFRTSDGVGLALVRSGEGVRVEARPALDGTKRSGHLRLEGARGELLARPGTGAVGRLLDRAALAVSAEMIGVAEGILAMTVQYAKDRRQFGSPIGRFQGVKHPLAELYVDIECLKSLVYYGAWAVAASPDELPAAASKAKAFASECLTRAGVTCIQLHGAVGYTEEYDVHLYLRRTKWARPIYGDECHHYERVAKLGGL